MKRIGIVLAFAVGALGIFAATAASSAGSARTVSSTAASMQPFTFYLTHYALLGSDPNNPTGVRYQSNGRPSAKNAEGSKIVLSGKGGWDPALGAARGGGAYTITNKNGNVTARGTWRATSFVSFLQLPGWWGNGFREVGWQGPPGSASFSGTLTLRVEFSGLGRGVLKLWCLMPETPKPGDHVSDGMSLTGPNLDYTDYHDQEQSMEGVMFYGS